MKYKNLIILFLMFLISSIAIGDESKHNYIPNDGYVPNAATAIKIAVAVWGPIYGEKNIKDQAPYNATLKNGVWYVSGSFNDKKEVVNENGKKLVVSIVGGVAEAEISKKTGEILRISHGE